MLLSPSAHPELAFIIAALTVLPSLTGAEPDVVSSAKGGRPGEGPKSPGALKRKKAPVLAEREPSWGLVAGAGFEPAAFRL